MTDDGRKKRWRLILGGQEDDLDVELSADDLAMDRCLTSLYGESSKDRDGRARRGGLGKSAPSVARWLGDIRRFFPTPVVRVMQRDAIERLGLEQMLLEPELLEAVEPDVHLVANLIQLKDVMPARAKQTARIVVARVVEDLMRRLREPMREAVRGSLDKATRNRRPRLNEIDWHRTIRANLSTYVPEKRTIIPEVFVGYGRKRSALKDILLCVDQSGSMAASVVYSGIFAAVLASLPAVRTRLVVFDTAVVDLTEALHDDPVDLLFGVQIGGGTDINRAIGYCQGLVERPEDTILVLISDLFEGGDRVKMIDRVRSLVASGVNVVALLALDDEGAPWHDHAIAAELASMGVAAFACTPDQFPSMMAAAIGRHDLAQWAAREGIVTERRRS